ncbi:MAG: helix-turn-helix domain-containing protein [Leptolyngbyaceae cyanobacterium MO_188.B28]|nr:helix-turn-helix domain-containing protein [Leptolyngbyaceae cyanobacterium MO_188.B28]
MIIWILVNFDYRVEQKRAAQELGISFHSLQRFQRQYREQGLDGLKYQFFVGPLIDTRGEGIVSQ